MQSCARRAIGAQEETVESKLLLSRREAAAALSISLRTLDKLVSEKQIRTQQIGSRRLIPRRALEKFAEATRTTDRIAS
jgi:excisionase family DNA binding protein